MIITTFLLELVANLSVPARLKRRRIFSQFHLTGVNHKKCKKKFPLFRSTILLWNFFIVLFINIWASFLPAKTFNMKPLITKCPTTNSAPHYHDHSDLMCQPIRNFFASATLRRLFGFTLIVFLFPRFYKGFYVSVFFFT